MKKSEMKNVPEYFANRIKTIEEEDLCEALSNSFQKIKQVLEAFPKEKLDYRYEEGKWTIKEILIHLIDMDRIMSFWALLIARSENFEVRSQDQNGLVKNSNAGSRNLQDMIKEYSIVRESTIALYKSFDDKTLMREGKSANFGISILLLGFITVGHELHHLNVIKE